MAQNVKFNIIMKDAFSSVAAKLKTSVDKATKATAKFNVKSIKMKANLTKVGAAAKKTGSKIKALAGSFKMASAAAGAFAAKAIYDYDKQAVAEEKVRQGLKNIGTEATISFEDAKKMASDLQKVSLFGDEDILENVTTPLLEVAGLSKKAFGEMQEAALNAATAGGKGLKMAGKTIAKVLKSGKVTMLEGLGAAYAMDPKRAAEIQNMTDKVKRSAMIMDFLKEKNKGMARAAALVGAGPLKQLGMAFGDVSESIGKQLLPYIKPLVTWLFKIADAFNEPNNKIAKIAAAIVVLVIVIAPLLAVAAGLVTVFGFVATALGVGVGVVAGAVAVFAGLALAVGAVIALAYYFNEEIGEWLQLDAVFTFLADQFNLIWGWIKKVVDAVANFSISNMMGDLTEFLSSKAGSLISAVFGIGGETKTTNDTNVKVEVDVKSDGAQTAVKTTQDNGRTQRTGQNMVGAV